MADLSVLVPSIIMFTITVGLHVGFGLYFLIRKRTFPLRARSPGLMIVLWTSIFAQIIRNFVAVFEGTLPCVWESWLKMLAYIHVLTLIVRCIRLLLIFNLAKYTLREVEDEDILAESDPTKHGQKTPQRKSFWSNPKLVSEFYMLSLLTILCIAVILVPTLNSIISSVSDTPNETCFFTERIASSTVYGLAALGLIIAAIKMRKIHDAFFIKNEFKWLAAFGVPIAVVSLSLGSFPATAPWNPFSNFCFYLLNSTTSFIIPSIISIKQNRSLSSGSRTTSSTTDATDDSANVKPAKLIDLLKSKEAMKYIEEFLAHYQMLKQSKNLLLYFDLLKFKALDNDLARTTKAYILFNKYLEKDAYIQIDMDISEEELESLRSTITNALKKYETPSEEASPDEEDDEESLEDIFDTIFRRLRKELKHKVIEPFVASEFYDQYLASIRLSQGLKEVESV